MILDDILSRTRADLPERRSRTPLSSLERVVRDLDAVTSLRQSLRQPGRITAIAEFKRRSPSAGWICEDAEIARIVPAYVTAGAAGLSILTDGPFFGGSLADLVQARAVADQAAATMSTPVPILRKDFIVDEYQIAEARAAGADAVLLIVAALDEPTLRALFSACSRWGIEALVETHSADEAERAVALGATVIGVNHRDLRTFTLDMELAARLRPRIPPECVMVAESGIRSAADVERLALAQVDAILVGETLMRAQDPGGGLRALLAMNK
jgi:indole-3-glycerol phosphate synthase